MTHDEIIRMAREAGAAVGKPTPEAKEVIFPQCMSVERFAALVSEATLEKAAKVCEAIRIERIKSEWDAGHETGCSSCAAAIRSMK